MFLISDRMKDAFEENNLTGWKCFPIRLLNKKGEVIEGYRGLTITGRCGPIDNWKSEVVYKRLIPNGPIGKYYLGLHVGLDEWDESDFFLPKGSYGTIVTSTAAEVIRSSKLTNIQLTNLAEIETPVLEK